MKKIVISTLPSSDRLVKRLYPVDGNTSIQVDVPVYFAVNSALANNLQKDDDVKVVATGGLVNLIANECKADLVVDPKLTLTGLKILYDKNM